MTISELRETLANVEEQDLTVRDLRNILREVKNQDRDADDEYIEQLTNGYSTYYTYVIDGETMYRRYDATDGMRSFFYDVTRLIAMSDCTDEEIGEIVFKGEKFHYAGWMPQMHYVYNGENGSEFEGFFPEFEH